MSPRLVDIVRSDWYLRCNEDVALAEMDPLLHFSQFGRVENRSPNPLFDPRWYLGQIHGLSTGMSAIEHYLLVGWRKGIDPHPLFDSSWYLRQAHTVPDGLSPLEHYLRVGGPQGVDPHPLFDSAWYLDRNQQLALGGMTPYEHFIGQGMDAGLAPCPLFEPSSYLSKYRDVASSGVAAFAHYWLAGRHEGRDGSPLLDVEKYSAAVSDDPALRRLGALAHFIHIGAVMGVAPSEDDDVAGLVSFLLTAQARSRVGLKPSMNELPLRIDWQERVESLRIPSADRPLVSVIVPTHNHAVDVIRCLESVAAAGDETPIEIILVDDASTGSDRHQLASIAGVYYVRLDENLGFAGAVAAGVAVAQAEFLLLLNNDTEVLPGWVDALVDEMNRHPGTGIAGSRILRDDLRLQEAGAILFSDGSGWQYGYGDDAFAWRYRTRRVVDYCSGAALLVRRQVWNDVDGFDERFSPAYYEDADLCIAARSIGHDTAYVPGSIILHNEGSSHGRDGLGTKKFQFRNKPLFREKWRSELVRHDPPESSTDGAAIVRQRDRRQSGHVLIIDHRVPAPDEDAGSVRMFHIIEDLVQRELVVHFLPSDFRRRQPWTGRLERMGVEVVSMPVDLGEYLRGLAPSLEFALVSRPEVAARHMSDLLTHCPLVPLAFDMVDAHGQRLRRQSELLGDLELLDDAIRCERLEAASARLADVVIAVSENDEQCIRDLVGVPLTTVRIPTVHHARDMGPGMSERDGLLFVGGFEHPPNLDAALYLLREILPIACKSLGDIPLVIAGSKPPKELLNLRVPRVTVTGWVPDLAPYYTRTRLVTAPLRFGAGVKGKIGEALSSGVPTITTSIGIEGMELQPGRDILIGDTPEDFAAELVRAYTDPVLWTSLRAHGAEAIELQFGHEQTHRRVGELIESLRPTQMRRR